MTQRRTDPLARNVVGRLPAAVMALPADVAAEFAPLVGLFALLAMAGLLPSGRRRW